MLYKNTVTDETYSLLKRMMALPALKEFALVGGTNLSLQLGHRLSIDLDFFSDKVFLSSELIPKLAESFNDLVVFRSTNGSFSGMIENVKIDIILYQYEQLEPLLIIDGIRLLSISDIIPMKLGAMAHRGAKKDFWDIAELLNHFTLEEMLNLFERKYKNSDFGYVVLALYYFEDAENQEDPIDLKGMSWKKVKTKIKKAVDDYIRLKK